MDEQDNLFNEFGTYGFTSDATNYALASFFLGKLRTYRQGAGEAKNVRNQSIGFYVQDDFRASRRLTFNLGLRWSRISPGAMSTAASSSSGRRIITPARLRNSSATRRRDCSSMATPAFLRAA